MANIKPKILFTIWPFIKTLPTLNINDILGYFFPSPKSFIYWNKVHRKRDLDLKKI